jgi:hypothetical protein
VFHLLTKLLSGIWGFIMLGLAVWAAWWTYYDAKSRNMVSWFWAVLSLLFFPLGFFIYLVIRFLAKPKSTT